MKTTLTLAIVLFLLAACVPIAPTRLHSLYSPLPARDNYCLFIVHYTPIVYSARCFPTEDARVDFVRAENTRRQDWLTVFLDYDGLVQAYAEVLQLT